ALRDDPRRLAHLVHAYAVTVVDVTVGVDDDVEVDLVIREVRLVATNVPVDAGRSQHRAGLSQGERVLRAEQPDALRALGPDLVSVDEPLVLLDRAGHPLDELAALRIEAARHVLREPAGLEVARVHPVAGHELEQVEDRLALAEAVPEHRDRAELETR